MIFSATQRTLCAGALLGAVLLLLWITWASPNLLKIPDSLYYEASVISRDNFYDEGTREFQGEQLSKTRFGFVATSKDKGVLLVKNFFDVRTIAGEKIFIVERIYGINPQDGTHVPGFGDRDRSGFLFAPRHATRGKFTYWHINYDTPAELEYQGEEHIFGLPVYRYKGNITADQTANLGHLPGVPEVRGVNLDIQLELWIEPVSGWLVKYQDHTTAYYYDKKTGQRLYPWNKFSNTYTESSVRSQIELAQASRDKIQIVQSILPALGGLVVVTLLLLTFFAKRLVLLSGGIISVVGLTVMIAWYAGYSSVTQIFPNFASMKFNTALAFLFCGLALIAANLGRWREVGILGVVVSTVGLLTLSQYLFDLNLGIDQLFFEHAEVTSAHPGRMAQATAFSFLLAGLGLVALGFFRERRGSTAFSSILVWTLLGLGLVRLFGYLSGFEAALGVWGFSSMAIHTALAFILFAAALLNHLTPSLQRDFTLPFGIGIGLPFTALKLAVAKDNLSQSF